MRGLIIFGIPALAVASLALTGCDGTGPGQGPKAAATLPNPKAGLWRETFSRDGQMLGLIGDVRACLDGDARARLSALGSHTDRSMCADQSVTRDPDGGYRFSSTCNIGPGGKVVTQGELTGDLASRYRVHSQTDTTGASIGGMNGHHVMDIQADYLGPCPSDMKPGDVMIANGLKVNMNHLQAAARSLAGGG